MIAIKTNSQVQKMHKAGKLLAACHREIKKRIKPGVSTLEIDQFVEQYLQEHGASPEQKGYLGYPFATCASVNDVICHGFPSKEPLKNGDIVTIDMVVNLNGWLADSAWTYEVGQVGQQERKLMDVTKNALYLGVEQAVIGNRVGDISHSIQSYVETEGFSVVRDFIGHGIGENIHELPEIPHFGQANQGLRLKEGMVFTIEPMVNTGTFQLYIDDNGWAARTLDGGLSAQYEHTVAITSEGPMVLTEQE